MIWTLAVQSAKILCTQIRLKNPSTDEFMAFLGSISRFHSADCLLFILSSYRRERLLLENLHVRQSDL